MSKEFIPFGDAMGMEVAFSNGVKVNARECGGGQYIWVAGQIAFDKSGKIVGVGSWERQTEQCIENIKEILHGFGGGLEDVTSVTVFVKSMEGLKDIHKVRLKYFEKPYPASTLIQVVGFVHPDALLEIKAEAFICR